MKILLNGFDGRLGTEIRNVAQERNALVEPLTRAQSESPAELGPLLESPAVLCDVTLAAGTVSLCRSLLALPPETQKNCHALVVGTTGHSSRDLDVIRAFAALRPVVLVANFSCGILLFEQMLAAKTPLGPTVAELARALGFDLALWESHHTQKIDAPSGTAKSLAERAGIPLDRVAATRVGQVVGEHTLFLAGDSEELRITHTAHTRRLFAVGAIDLCKRITARDLKPGLWRRDEIF